MKKKPISLDKFRIHTIKKKEHIIGGNNNTGKNPDPDTGTGRLGRYKQVCIDESRRVVYVLRVETSL
ncbi:hypothetical protein [Nonlabens xiamenensis]|uniref:hypothetical protein n=1 Tax=Nonlabens xiamenensis TaxID=2341043 RepID=UPI000F60E1A8|nr:hypothetical protein [Nonlabens xiamenensis]